ncbi:MAG: hypothetical protein DHS20C18_37720 [Saprospiraceae bacterium]|nr:MAG: hypothetical protein DHS20C18_37720 [Saprospiraceae bacterium]
MLKNACLEAGENRYLIWKFRFKFQGFYDNKTIKSVVIKLYWKCIFGRNLKIKYAKRMGIKNNNHKIKQKEE